jgi:hypothetical protein
MFSQPAWSGADGYNRWQANPASGEGDLIDPIDYWAPNQFEYPKQSRMALDMMTVPMISSESERPFSVTVLMVTSLGHNRLHVGTVGLIQTLRS